MWLFGWDILCMCVALWLRNTLHICAALWLRNTCSVLERDAQTLAGLFVMWSPVFTQPSWIRRDKGISEYLELRCWKAPNLKRDMFCWAEHRRKRMGKSCFSFLKGRAVGTQRQRCRFDPDIGCCPCGVCMYSVWLCEFPRDAPVSLRTPLEHAGCRLIGPLYMTHSV